jgi:hypothetical protein
MVEGMANEMRRKRVVWEVRCRRRCDEAVVH